MAGVVSGMNRAGVSVTINGAPSSLPGETATPVAMVARDVLQKAHNLDEALKILREREGLCLHALADRQPRGRKIRGRRKNAGGDATCANRRATPSSPPITFKPTDSRMTNATTAIIEEATSLPRFDADDGTADQTPAARSTPRAPRNFCATASCRAARLPATAIAPR